MCTRKDCFGLLPSVEASTSYIPEWLLVSPCKSLRSFIHYSTVLLYDPGCSDTPQRHASLHNIARHT